MAVAVLGSTELRSPVHVFSMTAAEKSSISICSNCNTE